MTFHFGDRIKSITAQHLVGICQFYLATCQFEHLESRQKNSGMQQFSQCKGTQNCFAHQEKDIPLVFPLLPRQRNKTVLGLVGTL